MDRNTVDRPNVAVVSTRRSADEVEVALCEVPLPHPVDEDDIVVEMQASPINPSDIGAMLGPADPATARRAAPEPGLATTVLRVPGAAGAADGSVGASRRTGQEGAGRVVQAGLGAQAQALLGRLVGVLGTGTYSRYVKVRARDSIAFGEDVPAAAAAAAFINPLTALGMVDTMRREGSPALVHTAAASNLGRMLHRLCHEEGIGLVNVVRRQEQVHLLRSLGAQHVLDLDRPGFSDDLVAAVQATGATVAFDAIGGGPLAAQILAAMDEAAVRGGASFPHGPQYGTVVDKKVFVYGGLDPGPIVVERRFGTAWSVGGWLLYPFLDSVGPGRAALLRRRVAEGITTTFASDYNRSISLTEVLDSDVMQAYARRATGEKYLVDLSS